MVFRKFWGLVLGFGVVGFMVQREARIDFRGGGRMGRGRDSSDLWS